MATTNTTNPPKDKDNVPDAAPADARPDAPPPSYCETTTTQWTGPDKKHSDPEALSDAPPDYEPEKTADLAAYKKWNSIMAITYVAVPLCLGVLVSWLPIAKIPLKEAPAPVLVCCIASLVEIVSFPIFAIMGLHLVDSLVGVWEAYRFLSPVATGAYLWAVSNNMSCDDGADSPLCRVGQDMLRGVGIFRTLGQFGVAAASISVGLTLDKCYSQGTCLPKPQEKADEAV